MYRIRKFTAVLLAAALLYAIFGGSLTGVFAEELPVNITVDDYNNGTLNISWSMTGAAAAVITYHVPDTSDNAAAAPPITVLNANTAVIPGLKANYIYDICVTLYGAVNAGAPAGDPIGRGLLFYLPSITFQSATPSQNAQQLTGGGWEIGGAPKLKLSWKTPKVFYNPDNTYFPDTDSNAGNNSFIPANTVEARSYMQNSLNRIYPVSRTLSTLNYKINISAEMNLINSGPTHASLIINQESEDAYSVYVSGNDTVKADVVPAPNGYLTFELWGRADVDSSVPTLPTDRDDILPDPEILPGTVYYMNIKPVYKDTDEADVDALTVGKRADQNGSLLTGERSYTSTPIRFQITKDSANNIYVKVFKINQGSLDLPRLYYEVQATDVPSVQGDWTVKKTMDDSYFSGTSAVTVITGVNPNNTMYYKIVVKSESPNDRLESLPLAYTLTADTDRPPLPTGIAVTDRQMHTGIVQLPDDGDILTPRVDIDVRSTDITLSWDKPLNWDAIKGDLYFHFLLSTSQTEATNQAPVFVNGKQWGDESYSSKYRLAQYISAINPKIEEAGNRLEYTIDAFDLFKWEGDTSADAGDIALGVGDDDYPDFLLPNTVYYLQMYTTKEADRGSTQAGKMSDRSIITSFTTLGDAALDVPLPMSFSIDGNGRDGSTTGAAVNYVDVRFDKVLNLDWRNYTGNYDETQYSYNIFYDIYMNSRTDTDFFPIGTTQLLNSDITFYGADDPQSTSVRARISGFSDDSADDLFNCGLLPDTTRSSYNLFGSNLLPNTTYYLKIRTRLVIRSRSDPDEVTVITSMDTAILPVTTIRLDVTPPDDNMRKPLAPTDFQIAVDDDQNQLLKGNSVTFTWKRQEDDVIYELIRTSQKVSPTDDIGNYGQDPEYLSFLQEYGNHTDYKDDEVFYLDPIAARGGDPDHIGKFTYDSATDTCTYTVDKRMFPNKLYYFSLKAVRVNASREPLTVGSGTVTGVESVWVSIPVTTSLIEAPVSLEVVLDAELGFSWNDNTAGLTAEDYTIYVKGPGDADYRLMDRSRSTVVKDGGTYYGRVMDLKADTHYDIRVIKGANTPVCEIAAMKTRDAYHELEVRWIGKRGDNFERYDIAIMAEGGSEYTVLTASDLEQYVSGGTALPYYIEETSRTINNDTVYFHARIKSADVTLPGGIATRQPLRSNEKYYIKVRAVKIDPTETDFIAYSKYAGPVNSRTEFNQGDYDDTDREEQEKAEFLDKMEELEKGYFWRVAISSGITGILLKGERVADAIMNSSGDTFTIDMSELSVNISKDEIYVPVAVIKTMNSTGKNLLIRTQGSELLLRPNTLDVSANESIKEIMGRQEVRDLYVKLIIVRSSETSNPLPSDRQRVSDINELDVQALGLSRTDKDMAKMFHDRLYDEDSGLVSQKLSMLLNTYLGSGSGSAELIDKYTKSLVDMIEKELSAYIDSTLRSSKLSNAVGDITAFDAPISANLTFSVGSGLIVPYVHYDGASGWQKITSTTVQSVSSVRFNLIKTGRFVIMAAQSTIGDIDEDHWAQSYVRSLASKYDLGTVFPGIQNSFMPENKATCREVVLLYEVVTGRAAENTGLDIRQKSAKLGLDKLISPNSLMKNIKRQESAAVLLKLFSVKKGISIAGLKPGGRVVMEDEAAIRDEYYQSVVMIIDMEVMDTDGSGRFNPDGQMTRAEVVASFARLLELTGDL